MKAKIFIETSSKYPKYTAIACIGSAKNVLACSDIDPIAYAPENTTIIKLRPYCTRRIAEHKIMKIVKALGHQKIACDKDTDLNQLV